VADATDISLAVTIDEDVAATGTPGSVVYSFPVVIEVLGAPLPVPASSPQQDATLRAAASTMVNH
jgi:hypothetical protein